MMDVEAPPEPAGLWAEVFGGGFINSGLWLVIFAVVGTAAVIAVFGDRRKEATADLVYGLLRSQVSFFLLLVTLGYMATYSPFGGARALLGFFVWVALSRRPLTIGLFCGLVGAVAVFVALKWRRMPKPTALGSIGVPLAIVDQIIVVVLLLALFATYA